MNKKYIGKGGVCLELQRGQAGIRKNRYKYREKEGEARKNKKVLHVNDDINLNSSIMTDRGR